ERQLRAEDAMVYRRSLKNGWALVAAPVFAAPFLAALALLAGCGTGAASSGSFDRAYTVSGPIRLDLANASGEIRITGTSDNKVHVHGEIRARGFFFSNPEKQAQALSTNPPVEQRPDVIRIGRNVNELRGVRIDYTIEAPQNSEISTKVASGSQTIS